MFGALDPVPGHRPGEFVVPNDLTMQGGWIDHPEGGMDRCCCEKFGKRG